LSINNNLDKNQLKPATSLSLLDDVRDILRTARQHSWQAVNTFMVQAYWNIGRRIVQEEQQGKERAEYGKTILKNLSRSLGEEFGKGVSIANLKNFRQFYLTFPDFEKSYTLCSQLTWSHWRLVMRVENIDARTYYIRETEIQGWSCRQLERNITTHSWKRLMSTPIQDNPQTPPVPSHFEFVKDPNIFEFLDLPENHTEQQLEEALITRLRDFLMELGKGFSFVGRQFRISTETSHFYIDLVFYNYILKCFVLIDLKTQKLKHADIGQMDMYVRLFNDLKCNEDDNPTIGIILCSDKDETIVKYSVLQENQYLFASKYRLVLPSEEELQLELERRHILDWKVNLLDGDDTEMV